MALQQAINGLPLASVYALLAAAYSLVYGFVGRINLAFGPLAAAGGYGAALGAMLMMGGAPGPILGLAFVYAAFVAATWGFASSRWVFQPLSRATGQIFLVATIGLALFLNELMRLTQGAKLTWVSPVLNQPFGVARAGDFIVTTAINAWLSVALALFCGVALIALMKFSEFGRRWRACSDDAFCAQLFGVDPAAIFAATFTLASGLAGIAGYVMTMFYGSVGYGAAMTLGLKALVAAILGGIGSATGAFLGGLIIGGFEAVWSAAFPIDYRDVAVFALLAFLMTLKPGGILGVADPGGDEGPLKRLKGAPHRWRRLFWEAIHVASDEFRADGVQQRNARRRTQAQAFRMVLRRLHRWIVTVSIWIALTIATLGFAWFFLPSLFPAVAVVYHALTVSGRRRGTYGMRALDLEVVTFEFRRPREPSSKPPRRRFCSI